MHSRIHHVREERATGDNRQTTNGVRHGTNDGYFTYAPRECRVAHAIPFAFSNSKLESLYSVEAEQSMAEGAVKTCHDQRLIKILSNPDVLSTATRYQSSAMLGIHVRTTRYFRTRSKSFKFRPCFTSSHRITPIIGDVSFVSPLLRLNEVKFFHRGAERAKFSIKNVSMR